MFNLNIVWLDGQMIKGLGAETISISDYLVHIFVVEINLFFPFLRSLLIDLIIIPVGSMNYSTLTPVRDSHCN